MGIGIDISQIIYRGTGVGRFTHGLVESILEYDKKNKWFFFFSSLKNKLDEILKMNNDLKNSIKDIHMTKEDMRIVFYDFKVINIVNWHTIPVDHNVMNFDYIFFDGILPTSLKNITGNRTISFVTTNNYDFHFDIIHNYIHLEAKNNLIDFKKFLYQEEKKEKDARKGVKKGVVKDINLGLFIGVADLERMEKRSKEFLSEGHQVRINLLLRGRENAKRDMAFALVNKFIVSLGEVNISKEPRLEGKILRAVVAKKK